MCVSLVHKDLVASKHSEKCYDERYGVAQQHVSRSMTILLTQEWLFHIYVS